MDIRIRDLLVPLLSVLVGASSERGAIEAAAQAWIEAYNARDAERLIALTTEDVVLLDPSAASVSGQEAARQALRRAVAAAAGHLTSDTKEIVLVDDVAWRIAALTHAFSGSGLTTRGQSLEIWKRSGAGWKLHRHMSSSILSQPDVLQPPPRGPMRDSPAGPEGGRRVLR
jgi:uncharacterized protein (TIGR02246 family)